MTNRQDHSQEPDAEPEISRVIVVYFRTSGRKPGNQENKAERALGE